MKKIVLCFTVLALFYVGINSLNSYGKEETYGDKGVIFNEKTILGNQLVIKSNIHNYNNYYVIRFFNNNYIVHHYCYLDDMEEYVNMYRELTGKIVDYNYDDLMIRSVLTTGNMSYYDFYDEYIDLINNESFSVIY